MSFSALPYHTSHFTFNVNKLASKGILVSPSSYPQGQTHQYTVSVS